jgi:hypothetical protein
MSRARVLLLLEYDVVGENCATGHSVIVSLAFPISPTLFLKNLSCRFVSERSTLHLLVSLRTSRVVPRCNMGVVIRKIRNALRST